MNCSKKHLCLNNNNKCNSNSISNRTFKCNLNNNNNNSTLLNFDRLINIQIIKHFFKTYFILFYSLNLIFKKN